MNFHLLGKKPSGGTPVTFIIAGLGNPGREYENTRHNAGFAAIDRLAEKCGVKINNAKFQALTVKTELEGTGVLFMKPQTFMNASGTAISEAAKFYKVPADRIIVLCDDITQTPGKIRVRRKGSAGGHNGLKSIIAWCGTEEFPRVRIGVGEKPNPEYDLAAWVLGKLPENDRKLIEGRLDDVCGAVSLILKGEYERAMSLYNG